MKKSRNRARENRSRRLEVLYSHLWGTWEAHYTTSHPHYLHIGVDNQVSVSAAIQELRRVHRLQMRRIVAAGSLEALLDGTPRAVTFANTRNGWAWRRISIDWPKHQGPVYVTPGGSADWDGTEEGRPVTIKALRRRFHEYLRKRREKRANPQPSPDAR